MTTPILLFILGFGVLIKSAGWLVDGASALARKYNVSDLTIGLTIVAFGTSAPELIINVVASVKNHHAIVYGNIIGSNIFNLYVILGIAGLITPLIVHSKTVWKEIPLSLIAIVFLFVLSNDFYFSDTQVLSRFDGLLMLTMFGVFLLYISKQIRRDRVDQKIQQKDNSGIKIWVLIIVSLAGLVIGGRLVIDNAVYLVTRAGVSEHVIGLTLIAAGTSLPELAASVAAAVKRNIDIAVGNVIGSNIFNIFLILGLSSLIRPVVFDREFNIDIYLLAFGTLLLFAAVFTGKKKIVDRWEAGLFIVIFIGYTLFRITSSLFV